MTIEQYLKLRDKGNTLDQIQKNHYLSEGTVWTLELGYQCYLKKLPLDKAVKIIKEHNEIPGLIARNLVAWDTSKDKREGLLPEVYVYNQHMYEKLTGAKYTFTDACKRFNIGD